ncbi:MAG TPA: hypothetical protein VIH42_15270, partial [Thermoguttaceae bacterium]
DGCSTNLRKEAPVNSTKASIPFFGTGLRCFTGQGPYAQVCGFGRSSLTLQDCYSISSNCRR